MPDPKNFKPKVGKPLLHDAQLCGVRFSPDGKFLLGGTFVGTVRRWDTSTDAYTLLSPLTGHQGWVQQIVFHPDGQRVFTADSFGAVACWPCANKEPQATWFIKDAHTAWIHTLAVSPDTKTVASAGRDRTVRLSQSDTGRKVTQWNAGDDVLAIAFHPKRGTLFTGDLHGVIKEWDVTTQKVVRELDAKGMFLRDRIQDVGGVRCFAFNSDGTKLYAGGCQPKTGGFVEGRHLLYAFDDASGKADWTYKSAGDPDGYIHDILWHKDGYLLAVTSGQPGQGKLLAFLPTDAVPFFTHSLPNAHALTLHPNGTRLVVSATNANSSGNGRPMTKDREYPGNSSPLHVFDLPA